MKLKYFIFTGLALISLIGFGQEVKSLTNQVVERIQIQECANSEAPSCTQDTLEKAILPILEKYLKELPVDTLDLRLGFTVNPASIFRGKEAVMAAKGKERFLAAGIAVNHNDAIVGGETLRLNKEDAVSYTHLTLPTKIV